MLSLVYCLPPISIEFNFPQTIISFRHSIKSIETFMEMCLRLCKLESICSTSYLSLKFYESNKKLCISSDSSCGKLISVFASSRSIFPKLKLLTEGPRSSFKTYFNYSFTVNLMASLDKVGLKSWMRNLKIWKSLSDMLFGTIIS